MAVTADAFFVANCLGNRLTQGNTYVFDGMVCIDVEITFGFNFKINQAMARHLIKHVIKKWNPGVKRGFAGAIKIDTDFDASFQRVAIDYRCAGRH